ncbi:MAG: DUF4214 domain-containing protein [Gammaproteobacteria bacterium]
MRARILLAAVAALLAGCGAQPEAGPAGVSADLPAAVRTAGSVHAAEVSYADTVAQLYLAYFLRPADPAGEESFIAQLRNLGLPSSLEQLNQMYGQNGQAQALVNSFALSAESSALYAGADDLTFLITVFRNVLGRDVKQEGLIFWLGALQRGELTRAKAALSIMVGALNNNSEQGLIDRAVIRNRVAFMTGATNALRDQGLQASYRGADKAAMARRWLGTVTEMDNAATIAAKVADFLKELKGELAACDPASCAPPPKSSGDNGSVQQPDPPVTTPPSTSNPNPDPNPGSGSGTPSTQPTGQWDAQAVALDTVGYGANFQAPVLVADASGTVTALWQRTKGGVPYASRRAASAEAWSAPQALAVQLDTESAVGVNAVTLPNGDVVVAWGVTNNDETAGNNRSMVARYSAAAGTWSSARLNATRDHPTRSAPQLVADGNGVVTAIILDATFTTLYATRYEPASATWALPTVLAQNDAADLWFPAVAGARDGTLIVAWAQTLPTRGVFFTRFTPGVRGWSNPAVIDTRVEAPDLSLAWDEVSGFTLAYLWPAGAGGSPVLAASRLAPGASAWASSVQVSVDQPFDAGFVAAPLASSAGHTTLAYANDDGVDAVRTDGSTMHWSAPRALLPPAVFRPKAVLSADPFGNATLLYANSTLGAVRYSAASGKWLEAATLGGAFGEASITAFQFAQAVDRAGNVTAVWIGPSQVNGGVGYVVGSKRWRQAAPSQTVSPTRARE